MLHVADAANCVAAKNGGKNENTRLPSLFPDLSRDGIAASRGPSRFVTSHSRFLLAVVSVTASESGARFSKVSVTLRARNQIFKSKSKE